jgi:hypothetical protein
MTDISDAIEGESEDEIVVIRGEPGLIDGIVEHWSGQGAPSILSGDRDFSVDCELYQSYDHVPESTRRERDRAKNGLAWYLFSHGVRGEQRDVREERNRVREGEAVVSASGSNEN